MPSPSVFMELEMKKSAFFKGKRLFSWIPFLVALLIGVGLSLGVATMRGVNWKSFSGNDFRWLSDGFFVISVLYNGIGLLVLISSETDFFDMISYAFRNLLMLFSLFKRPEETQNFYDYKMDRRKKRAQKDYFILMAGIVLLIAAIVFLLLYRKAFV